MDRLEDYKKYHLTMMEIGDCDPAYPALNYIANRFELNIEQRYWIAWLYACTYCVPTVYYIYNEFPDYENVDIKRLQNWWSANKEKTIFQTDRLKVKSFDKFILMFGSYRLLIGKNQQEKFESLITSENDVKKNYNNIYNFSEKLYYFGRFSLFLYLESLYNLTKLPLEITWLPLKEAESSRNGLCYAMGLDHLIRKNPCSEDYNKLNMGLEKIIYELKQINPTTNYWNVETSLCSYKKMFWKKRYLGYYIDRLMVEIQKMEINITKGVDWSPLWQFREETFNKEWLGEKCGWKSIRKNLFGSYDKQQILSR